jgi:hypothetical protein
MLCAASLLASVGAIASCGSDASSAPDAGADGNSPCPTGELFYTGELIDWLSTPAKFKGIFDATLTVEDQPARTDKTSPNGRFELCLVNTAVTRVKVDAIAASMYFDGVAIAESEVINSGITISMRSLTPMQSMNNPLLPDKAHVIAEIAGTARSVSLTGAIAPTLVFDGSQWIPGGPGVVGTAAFFANLEVSDTPSKLAMSGSSLGGKSVPLLANQITFVAIVGK